LTTPAPSAFDSWFRGRHPEIRLEGAHAVLELSESGATVPFITRYRKERTGNLDEVAIRSTLTAKELWDRILNRQTIILEAIERQKKLTPELKAKVVSTLDLDALEDLYLPYKQKRKTRSVLAREAGLEPLADWIWNCGHGTETPLPGQTLDLWAFTFRNLEKGITTAEAAMDGARDILVERIAETLELRARVRQALFEKGWLRAAKTDKAKPHSKYETYFAFQEKVSSLRETQSSHRYLAVRRGTAEGELSLAVGGPPDDAEFEARLTLAFEGAALSVPDSPGAAVLKTAARMALRDHVLPSIENEVHRALKNLADEAAIRVFAENVRRLLLEAPFGPKPVLGVDPGLRTGCKLAAVDAAGAYVENAVIHIETDEGKARARALLAELCRETKAEAVAVGNGTAGREAEVFVRAALGELGVSAPVVLVSEAGASVYSASDVAREEFPSLDATVRGAISIARRMQDPLAELVKVEPRSIGVGQYQHDVAPAALARSLEAVVDSCVNQVGVNLNTASRHLLAHVSGIGPALAGAIVEHRERAGLFASRAALLEVPRFGAKAFEQAAGFLRIPGSVNPLDNTGVHPEQYPVLEGLAARLGRPVSELLGPGVDLVRQAAELRDEVGAYTYQDILGELEKPGRDPRDAFVPFSFREDVHTIEELKPGTACPGIVTNVTNFGAFVDVGVHHDGLVHISQLGDRFVKDPREVVKPGDRVQVRVLKVDLDKKQISLSMRSAPSEGKAPRERREKKREAPPPTGDGRPARGEKGRGSKPQVPRVTRPPGKPDARPGGRGPSPPAGSASSRPPGPRPPSPARPGSATPGASSGVPPKSAPPSSQRPGRGQAPPADRRVPAKPAFNNPFAVLAKLKDPGKS
jgi:protein Tex